MFEIKKNRTLVFLFLFSAFLAGMVLGVMVKSKETGGTDNPIFTLLIFCTGLSVGAFITRLQQEFRIKGGSHISGEKTINN
ncbi:MAG: hypothetical protein EOP49_30250 [Sphingobacteriales bacterium]|nr:MAG: hypothetical protein EOP49_30250 [Sphingobacteriales bacterium]